MTPLQAFSRSLMAACTLLLLIGCNNEPESGPAEVRWDRETCERCVMSVSDPDFSAQIRGGPTDAESKLYKFDDLGCAIIWLDQQSWKDNPTLELWVNQYQTGDWIDARQAFYVKNQLTPMNYGLGASLEPTPGALNFSQAREHIYKIEKELNLHGGAVHLAPGSGSGSVPAQPQTISQ